MMVCTGMTDWTMVEIGMSDVDICENARAGV